MSLEPGVVEVTSGVLRAWPLPAPGGSKEARGRTLVVGGSSRTPGAVLLAAEAALRTGAGKLQIATVASVATGISLAVPEALVIALPETADGTIDPSGLAEVLEIAPQADAVLLGPGMTGEDETAAVVRALLDALGDEAAVVLDALALAPVSADAGVLGATAGRAVLTPNLPELGYLLAQDPDAVDDARTAVRQVVRRTGAVVTGGGAESWTVAPDGRTWHDGSGGPGLGVSGSGDVQAGAVAGLLARGAEPAQAAVWATHLHKRAGERLAAAVGTVGFLARELPPELPKVLLELQG
ncbi:hydroxyethylthiazole kinase-like uncharacterized protein yjeF [Motilibacter rhizosphaerae]|uniref:ADP-dependent (S)-NAD(P)H-hydrate dehydratase n=1 Tax=Motilibacter rhizosphaerae TaxID=598652 RepID=A0A4Q7NUV0_9ACTN|nr:NAD(P)H-hydrate dehydratase [Motilibacter rhizosphaerae]RZS90202.1 hydroxyethylthiazole kinase-like uncharacterized protein yjeF [Motilibacter rhizosphaerae]